MGLSPPVHLGRDIMGIEGLDLILNKQEVVPTVSAIDLVQHAERVDSDYRRHVRTYVPLSRAGEGQEDTLTVDEFVRRTIKGVKEAKALRGHLTAEFGYGKTTTALYLWQKAEDANLVATPPFQMLQLPDLVTATHGWMRYRLSVRQPSLVPELDALYQEVTGRSLEREAEANRISLGVLREYFAQGRFVLELQPVEYVSYFERVTDLALRARFDGLLVMPDEIQQYIEPAILRSNDPIVPFFNVLQAINTRAGYLKFGLIIVVPLKELGVIRETRGRQDVIHRMNDIRLDLSTIYDSDFAARLWQQFAEEFGFRSIASSIITQEALDALGEMAARNDLSNGPRTVVNVFRRVVERYKTYGSQAAAYTPLDLVDDLISGAIQFSGNSEIQNVTRRALQNAIVRRNLERYERAVKLAAAFPSSGAPLAVQQKYGVHEALDELMQQALGELVMAVGPIDQHGVTLYGLQVGIKQTDWLAQAIRDFRRVYAEHHAHTKERILRTFTTLLRTKIFNNWSLIDERPSTYTANHSLIFEGDFSSFVSRFPRRRVHVRIFWENEELKDAEVDGDIAVEFHLSMYTALRERPNERRQQVGAMAMDYAEHTVRVPLNLMYVRPEGIPPQIQQKLQDVWSPYDLSPAVLMNIYAMLEEKRADKLIPRSDDQWIANGFQPDLIDAILRDLFNAEVGAALGGVSQRSIVETAAERLLTEHYGDTYHTIMASSNWRSSLGRYINAIRLLLNVYQKRGELEFEGTKSEIAELFTVKNTTLDNIVAQFPDLLVVTRDFRGKETGAVKFTLHDLEARILHWLRESPAKHRLTQGKKTVEVRTISTGEVYQWSRDLGYRDEETEQLVGLLVERGFIEIHQNRVLREVPSPTVDLDEVVFQLNEFQRDLKELLSAFPSNSQLAQLAEQAGNWQNLIDQQRRLDLPEVKLVMGLANNIRVRHTDLRHFVVDKQTDLLRRLGSVRQGIRPIPPQHLQSLDKQILGSVSYVGQVNAIRRAVVMFANKAKGQVDALVAQLDKTATDLKAQELTIVALARCAKEVERYEQDLSHVKELLDTFEGYYRNITGWTQLVVGGSELFDELQQMMRLADVQMGTFERIAREISGRISSAGNKLDVLPDHAIYGPEMQELREQVRTIRNEAETAFTDLQLRYQDAFTSQGLMRREQLGRPLTYNVSSPEESYHLLYENVQGLARQVVQQIESKLRDYASEAQNTLATPLIRTLVLEDRDRVTNEGKAILADAEGGLAQLKEVGESLADLVKIQDFPRADGGAFSRLIRQISEARDLAAALSQRIRGLTDWLSSMSLTDDEQKLLERLPLEGSELTIDLVDWRTAARVSDDQFWSTFRSLYEKRRVRILIGRVRD